MESTRSSAPAQRERDRSASEWQDSRYIIVFRRTALKTAHNRWCLGHATPSPPRAATPTDRPSSQSLLTGLAFLLYSYAAFDALYGKESSPTKLIFFRISFSSHPPPPDIRNFLFFKAFPYLTITLANYKCEVPKTKCLHCREHFTAFAL